MNDNIGHYDVEGFRDALEDCLGLHFEDSKFGFLADVLGRRLSVANNWDCARYFSYLRSDRPRAELAALADELTVPETYFFRNIDQFHALAQHVVPERMKVRAESKQLRVLSAGCASGEEAFTIAMVLRDVLESGWEASILGVDLNPSVLQRAKHGRFSTWSLRETPPAMQQRWFTGDGRDVMLDDEIRTTVRFEQHNLAEDDRTLWGNEQFDVIFCRNVLMYFAPLRARELVERVTRALVPDGFLFLGHAETLRGLTHDFHLCHTHRTFYYQRRSDSDRRRSAPSSEAVRPAHESTSLTSLVEGADTWVEAIQAASERVRQLVDATQPPAATPSAAAITSAPPRGGLGEALELLREEHYGEALELLEALPGARADDPDALLLRAVLLTHTGRLTTAEAVCHRLLEVDELSAPAHYVLALCREGAGDIGGAFDHDRIASYLDPGFAMPRLHLGLLGRRARDFTTMRDELAVAIELLEREEASRLLLFGGGFSRDALIALCQAELRDGAAV